MIHDELLFTSWVRLWQSVPRTCRGGTDRPHPHCGALPKYQGVLPEIHLTDPDRATLHCGRPVFKRPTAHGRGEDIAVFWVKAPVATVWSVITDHANYVRWIDGVTACQPYCRRGSDCRVRFRRTLLGHEVQYFVRYQLQAEEALASWSLDYDYESEVDDAVGFWRVSPVSASPVITQVECAETFKLRRFIPGLRGGRLFTPFGAFSWVQVRAEDRERAQHTPRRPPRRVERPPTPAEQPELREDEQPAGGKRRAV